MNKYRSGGKTTPKAKVAAKPKAKVAAKPKKAYQSGGVAKAAPKSKMAAKPKPKAKEDTLGPLTEREKFLIQQAREADMDRKMQEAAARHQKTRLKPKGYARGGGIDQFGRFDPSINRYFQSQPPRPMQQPAMSSGPMQPQGGASTHLGNYGVVGPRGMGAGQSPRQPMGNTPSTQAPSSFTPQAPSYDKGVVGPGTMPTRQPPRQPPQMPSRLPPRLPMGNSLGAGAPAVGLGMGMASGRSGRSSSPMDMDRPRPPKRSRRTR